MRSEKQKASTKYYKTSYKKFEDLTFDEKVRRKEMLDRPGILYTSDAAADHM